MPLGNEKQLNIRSDEAYEIAHRFALEHRMTVKEVVIAALRFYRDELAAESRSTPSQLSDSRNLP
jgi:hypothetical protein